MRCQTCEGSGWRRFEIPCTMYPSGYAVVAKECFRCHGTGKINSHPEPEALHEHP